MNKNSLKDFLELNIEPTNLNRKDISLDAEEEINKERIKKLFGEMINGINYIQKTYLRSYSFRMDQLFERNTQTN